MFLCISVFLYVLDEQNVTKEFDAQNVTKEFVWEQGLLPWVPDPALIPRVENSTFDSGPYG